MLNKNYTRSYRLCEPHTHAAAVLRGCMSRAFVHVCVVHVYERAEGVVVTIFARKIGAGKEQYAETNSSALSLSKATVMHGQQTLNGLHYEFACLFIVLSSFVASLLPFPPLIIIRSLSALSAFLRFYMSLSFACLCVCQTLIFDPTGAAGGARHGRMDTCDMLFSDHDLQETVKETEETVEETEETEESELAATAQAKKRTGNGERVCASCASVLYSLSWLVVYWSSSSL